MTTAAAGTDGPARPGGAPKRAPRH
jgi:hypothetical protein